MLLGSRRVYLTVMRPTVNWVIMTWQLINMDVANRILVFDNHLK